MDFDEFFDHSFIRGTQFCDNTGQYDTVPIPVPRPLTQRSSETSQVKDEVTKPHQHARVARLKEQEAPESLKPKTPIAVTKQKENLNPRSPKPSGGIAKPSSLPTTAPGKSDSSDSSGQFEDFVMVDDAAVPASLGHFAPNPTSPTSLPRRLLNRTLRPLVNYALPEPLPVPTQRAAFEQIQRSNIGVIHENGRESSSASPSASSPQISRAKRMSPNSQVSSPPTSLNLKRQDSCSSIGSAGSGGSRGSRNMLMTDVSQMSPPPVNFTLGSSPGFSSPPNILNYSLNRSRKLSVPPLSGPQSFFK